MAEPIRQKITIDVEDGNVVIDPEIRDLYRNEEVEWICTAENWEVVFEPDPEEEVIPPFVSDTFGPGLEESGLTNKSQIPADELPGYLTGKTTRQFQPVRDFNYSARVRGYNPRTARVRVFRGVRDR